MYKPTINASDHPDGELIKEVYARFGLCMYMAQVFETGLINILTALETRAAFRSKRQGSDPRKTFDSLYEKHESFTFGNLMRALTKHDILPLDLIAELGRLKKERDHLAHRFFREHDIDFMSVGGCYVMIEQVEKLREEFQRLDARVDEFVVPAFERIGISAEFQARHQQEEIARMMEEAKSRYSSSIDKS